jgi:hypothetical protein
MAELLSIYSEGALHDEALEQALGVDTDGLDNAFRASLGLAPLPGTEPAPAEAAKVEETNEDAVEPVEAAASVEQAEVEPVDNSDTSTTTDTAATSSESGASATEDASSPTPLGALPCTAGLLFLLVAGGVVFGWRWLR